MLEHSQIEAGRTRYKVNATGNSATAFDKLHFKILARIGTLSEHPTTFYKR